MVINIDNDKNGDPNDDDDSYNDDNADG